MPHLAVQCNCQHSYFRENLACHTLWVWTHTIREEVLRVGSPRAYHFNRKNTFLTWLVCLHPPFLHSPQWGAADTEMEVPSGENTELKGSPLKAWSRSVYSNTCYAYCQGFLPSLFLSFRSIHLHFFQNLSQFFPVLAVANTGFCAGPQNKIGHPAGRRFLRWVPMEYE